MEFVRGTGFWLLAWFVSAALWMLLTDSIRPSEMFAGAAVAALAATGFELVRRQRIARQALRPALALRIWRVLARVPADVVRLIKAAFVQAVERSPARGRIVALPFPSAEDDPAERARRAVAVGFGSIAPNTIIVGVDPETGQLLAHQLEPTYRPDDLDPLRLR